MRKGIAIIGCGGVGSNLAYMLSRADSKPEKMILIDHDTINEGNLSRQMFSISDVGENKAEALGAMLKQMNPEIQIEAYNLKIETEADLAIITDVGYTFICTDNMESKRLIDKAKKEHLFDGRTFFIGCEEDYFEIKNQLDSSDLATWSLESGYNSTQAARSNISAAFFLYDSWCVHRSNVNSIVNLNDFSRVLRQNITLETNVIQLSKNNKEILLHGDKEVTVRGGDGKLKRFNVNVPSKIYFHRNADADNFIREALLGGMKVYTSREEGVNQMYKEDLESILEKRNKKSNTGGNSNENES